MRYVTRYLVLGLSAVCILFSACSNSGDGENRAASPLPGTDGILRSASAVSATYDYTYNECVYISSPGENEPVTIAGNVFVPVAQSENETFPAIIFCNSWSLDEHEYVVKAASFAKKGYIVLSYSARGWGLSGGKVALGSGEDRADFRSVVDWLITNTPVNAGNIGVCGISLGGGTALAALAHDERIKTAVGISAWTDLETHMFSDSTPRMVWGSLLVVTGTIVARMDQQIYSIFYSTLSNTNIPWLKEWCGIRSTINYVDDINRLNKPVYIANNMEDYLFAPDTVLAFFNALTVDHKRADLSLGTHFTGEATGLFDLPNYVFGNVEDWFDYWLKGIDTGIITDQAGSAVITMEEKNYLTRKVYDSASLKKSDGSCTWPPNSVSDQTFYLSPRGLFTNGGLETSAYSKNAANSFYSGLLSGATAGAAVFPILEQLGVEVISNVHLLNRAETIAWESDAFTSVKKIRGGSTVKINISLSQAKGQVILYLYDVSSSGKAVYITHGCHTFWDAVPGKTASLTIPIIATAYDIPAGHHLALVVDSSDPLYAKPTLVPFTAAITYAKTAAGQNTLIVPFEN